MSKKSIVYAALLLLAIGLGAFVYSTYESSQVRTQSWETAGAPETMIASQEARETSLVSIREETTDAEQPVEDESEAPATPSDQEPASADSVAAAVPAGLGEETEITSTDELTSSDARPQEIGEVEMVMSDIKARDNESEAELWALYEKGDLSAISARIVSIREERPEWKPSDEFLSKYAVLSDTERLLNAASVNQNAAVISIIKSNPTVLSCDRPETLWAANVAVYREMSTDEGVEMFEKNMAGCVSEPDQRIDFARRSGSFMSRKDIATVKNKIADPELEDAFSEAMISADISILSAWLSTAEAPRYVRPGDEDVRQTSGNVEMRTGELRPIPGGSLFFDEAQSEAQTTSSEQLMKTFGEGAALDGAYVSTTEVPKEVADARARLSETAQDLSADPLMTLSWFDYTSGDPRSAADRFEEARFYTDAGLTALQGEVLSRLAYEDYVVAESLFPDLVEGWETNEIYLIAAAHLVAHADRDPQDILYREGVSLDEAQANRIGTAALTTRDWDLSEKLGWHSHRLSGCEAALPWWRIARESNQDLEPAAFGIAMCQQEQVGSEEMASIRARWSAESPRIAMIFGDYQHTSLAERPAPRPAMRGQTVVTSGANGAEAADQSRLGGPVVLTRDRVSQMAPAPSQVVETAPAPAAMMPAPQPVSRATSSPRVSTPKSENRTPSRSVASAPQTQAARRNVDPCDPRVPLSDLSPQQALERGWCLMEQDNGAAATTAFSAASQSKNAQVRADAAYGESLKHLRQGDYMEAQQSLLREKQDPKRQREISAGILSAQAVANNRRGDARVALEALDRRQEFAEEPPNLMTLRGWSLWRLNKRTEARAVWSRAAELGDENAKKALREAGR